MNQKSWRKNKVITAIFWINVIIIITIIGIAIYKSKYTNDMIIELYMKNTKKFESINVTGNYKLRIIEEDYRNPSKKYNATVEPESLLLVKDETVKKFHMVKQQGMLWNIKIKKVMDLLHLQLQKHGYTEDGKKEYIRCETT